MRDVRCPVRVALVAVTTAAVLGLQACGGGGGGGGDSGAAKPASVDPSVSLAMTADNADVATGFGMTLADLALSMGTAQMDLLRELAASTSSTVSRACRNGGTLSMTWTDANADGERGAGDQVLLQFTDCQVDHVNSYLTGQVTLQVAARTAQSWSVGATFGAGFKLVDVDDQSVSNVSGSASLAWQDTGKVRSLTLTSSTLDDLQLSATYMDDNNKTVQDVEKLRAMRMVKTLSRATARHSTLLSYRLESVYLGGAITVSTPVPLSGYFDTFPDAGFLSVRGSGAGEARLTPNGAVNSRLFNYQFDAGSGGALDEGYGNWASFSQGVLWWGEAYGDQATFLRNNTRDYSALNFGLLQSPATSGTRSATQPLAYQLSRPLATDSLPRYVLVSNGFTAGGSDYLWTASTVPLNVTVDGAYMVLTPATQLQHGVTYTVQHADAAGQPASGAYLVDGLGNKVYDSGASFTVDTSLLSRPGMTSQVPMLTSAASVTLTASASVSTYGLAGYEWSQVDGPRLVFGSPNLASTTVAVADGVSTRGKATVELKVIDAQGQVERNRLTVLIDPDPAGTTYLYFRSDTGDGIGGGQRFLGRSDTATVGPAYGIYGATYLRAYLPTFDGVTDNWELDIAGNDGRAIHVGTYDSAARAPFHGGANGLAFSGDGRGCNTLTGSFEVLDVAYDNSGNVTRLAVDFVQHCEGSTSALYGSLRFHSAVPLKP